MKKEDKLKLAQLKEQAEQEAKDDLEKQFEEIRSKLSQAHLLIEEACDKARSLGDDFCYEDDDALIDSYISINDSLEDLTKLGWQSSKKCW